MRGADHPLLQLDEPDYGFRNLTKAETDEIDATQLRRLAGVHDERDVADDVAA